MKRLISLAICVYAPHLLEEYFTEMWRDPLLAPVLDGLTQWTPQHAAYFVFQVMLALLLTTTLLFGLGGKPQKAVLLVLGVSLLAESHHAIRFVVSHSYNSGLVSSLPMPIVGASIVLAIFRKEKPSCSTTSFSRWASGESRSA